MASLERVISLLRPGSVGFAGALGCAAQAYSVEEMCEKTVRKGDAPIATRYVNLALFVRAPKMDMLGYAPAHAHIIVDCVQC